MGAEKKHQRREIPKLDDTTISKLKEFAHDISEITWLSKPERTKKPNYYTTHQEDTQLLNLIEAVCTSIIKEPFYKIMKDKKLRLRFYMEMAKIIRNGSGTKEEFREELQFFQEYMKTFAGQYFEKKRSPNHN